MIWHAGKDKKIRTYTEYKENFEIEKYLLVIREHTLKRNIIRFRIGANNLTIETGDRKSVV